MGSTPQWPRCAARQEAFPFGMSKQTSDALGMVEEAEPMHLFETPFADGQVGDRACLRACVARAVWRLTTRIGCAPPLLRVSHRVAGRRDRGSAALGWAGTHG